jgi:asparagine synthase (glutamine-hydrolysing)
VTAFTAVGDERAPDYLAARENAAALGIELVSVQVPVPTSRDAAIALASDAVADAEVYAAAQVEIAVACRALARRIRAEGFKVVFSGEGSDELWGSYRPVRILRGRPDEWQAARRASVVGQWRKNFQRCNKVFLREGVECRLPFLHVPLVEYGLGLSIAAVEPHGRLKGVLVNGLAAALQADGVDPAIARRPRVAFQVGMGLRSAFAAAFPSRLRAYRELYLKHVWGECVESDLQRGLRQLMLTGGESWRGSC